MTGAVFDAWWVAPGTERPGTRSVRFDALDARALDVDRDWIAGLAAGLKAARVELLERPVDDIVGAIDAAAARLADRDDALRREAETRLSAATGYSAPMARLVLDRMTADWRRPALESLLEAELGDAAVLDGFVPRPPVAGSVSTRAYGPDLTLHVFAGNVPGVAVTSLVRALLVKSPSLGKLATGQPVLPVLFARALHSVDPALARTLAVLYWPGGSEDVERAALEAADVTVVYGGGPAETSLRSRSPAHRRIVVHGPRFSVGLIARAQADDRRVLRAAAQAIAAFDQRGCVSPHAVWVECGRDGGVAARTAEQLAEQLAAVEARLPRGRIGTAEASSIQQERGAAEMRHEQGVRLWTGEGTRWTVVYEPVPDFRPSCLNRFIRVHPVHRLEEVPERLAPVAPYLQSVALACDPGRRPRLAHRLAKVGSTRITTFERLPWPPPSWHHDGQPPLRELLRWVDLED